MKKPSEMSPEEMAEAYKMLVLKRELEDDYGPELIESIMGDYPCRDSKCLEKLKRELKLFS